VTTPDVKRLREMLREATPWPWRAVQSFRPPSPSTFPAVVVDYDDKNGTRRVDFVIREAAAEPDIALVVAMRNALPALLDEIDRLRRAIRKAHTLIDKAMGDTDPIDPDDPLLRAAQALSFALRDLDEGGR
jgi:hypothetical protein